MIVQDRTYKNHAFNLTGGIEQVENIKFAQLGTSFDRIIDQTAVQKHNHIRFNPILVGLLAF